ncbi:MAG: hypothetical protein RLY86_689 [Pseudomonadota bacterium]|jgi:hypothetical protein
MSRKTIEIFAAGSHTAIDGKTYDFSEADLATAAAAYDPAVHEAPIVVGHPKTDLPAYGWVAGLRADGGRLLADVDQVDPSFAELVAQGRFKKVSASFYLPGAAGNPTPGKLHLRHVGFLGAQPPAVKGLKQASFAEAGEGVVEFGDWGERSLARLLRSMREWLIGRYGQEEADKALPTWELDMVTEAALSDDARHVGFSEPAADPAGNADAKAAELAQREADLAAREARMVAREADAAAARATQRAAENGAFLEEQIGAGRVLPGEKAELVGFMSALDEAGVVSFAEGGVKRPIDIFKGFVAALPARVPMGEVAGGETVDFADPDAITAAAERHQAEQEKAGRTVTFQAAIRHVMKGASA